MYAEMHNPSLVFDPNMRSFYLTGTVDGIERSFPIIGVTVHAPELGAKPEMMGVAAVTIGLRVDSVKE